MFDRFALSITILLASTLLLACSSVGGQTAPSSTPFALGNHSQEPTITIATNTPVPSPTVSSTPVPALTADSPEHLVQIAFEHFRDGDYETVRKRWMDPGFAEISQSGLLLLPLENALAGLDAWNLLLLTDDFNAFNPIDNSTGFGVNIVADVVKIGVVDAEFDEAEKNLPQDWIDAGWTIDCVLTVMIPVDDSDAWQIAYMDYATSCQDVLLALTPTVTPTPDLTATQDAIGWLLSTPTPYVACPGTYPTRLWVGGYAMVATEPPLPNNVRAGASTEYGVIGKIQPGYPMEILDGPECANNWTWWKVRSLVDDLTGWTAEGDANGYWLIPCPPEGECGTIEGP